MQRHSETRLRGVRGGIVLRLSRDSPDSRVRTVLTRESGLSGLSSQDSREKPECSGACQISQWGPPLFHLRRDPGFVKVAGALLELAEAWWSLRELWRSLMELTEA